LIIVGCLPDLVFEDIWVNHSSWKSITALSWLQGLGDGLAMSPRLARHARGVRPGALIVELQQRMFGAR
jgi:hypothetical protein